MVYLFHVFITCKQTARDVTSKCSQICSWKDTAWLRSVTTHKEFIHFDFDSWQYLKASRHQKIFNSKIFFFWVRKLFFTVPPWINTIILSSLIQLNNPVSVNYQNHYTLNKILFEFYNPFVMQISQCLYLILWKEMTIWFIFSTLTNDTLKKYLPLLLSLNLLTEGKSFLTILTTSVYNIYDWLINCINYTSGCQTKSWG